MLKVVASQGANKFFVIDCDGDVLEAFKDARLRGRILDLETKKLHRPINANSYLTKCLGWKPATMNDEKLQEHLTQVEDMAKPWDEMKITNYDFMRHTMGRRPADWVDAPADNPTKKSQ